MPAHRLPPELLVIILDKCHKMEPFRFPWLASEVCSHWRQITLSTPTLWTDICLRFYSLGALRPQALAQRTNSPEALEAYHANQVPLARHQLAGSRDLPLNVNLSVKVASAEPFALIHEAVNLVLVQHAHHIQALRISETCIGLIAIAATVQQGPVHMPLLTSLDVSASGYRAARSPADRNLIPYHAFRLATNLVSATLRHFMPPLPDLCWSHLTDLTLCAIEVFDARKVLPHLTNLIDLNLIMCLINTPLPPSEMTPIVLPSLLHLFINCIPSALGTITAPRLETLSLMMWYDDELMSVIAFLQRSRCASSIHTLELTNLAISLEATISLLSCMPYVRKLDWKGGNVRESPIPTVVHALPLQDDNGRFKCCPRLHQLNFYLPRTHPTHFIDMIEQRWRTRPHDGECDTLREVKLVFHENFWPEDRRGCEDVFGRRIRGLMAEGMLVDVRYIGREDGEAWNIFKEIFPDP